jgi:hypothetical protein
MKKILAILGVTIFLISCGKKETKKEIVPENKVEEVKPIPIVKNETLKIKSILFFTVQIGANKKESKTFSSIEQVQVYKENQMFKYRLGNFKTYKEAKSFRNEIINKYPGSFVQAIKGNLSISIQEALK